MGTEARITIPEGTQTGKIFRLRGKGVPHLHGGGNGDLYVHAFVETPVNLTSKQKKMLKEFDESSQGRRHEAFAPEHELFGQDEEILLLTDTAAAIFRYDSGVQIKPLIHNKEIFR